MAEGDQTGAHRDPIDRRRFLATGASALAAAAGLGTFVSLAFLSPWDRERAHRAVVIGVPEDIPVGGVLVLPGQRIAVGHTEAGWYALSTVCPHLGCLVQWLEEEGKFHCPCHGSRFEPDGAVQNGPAREDLVSVAIGLDDRGRLVADPSAPPPAAPGSVR